MIYLDANASHGILAPVAERLQELLAERIPQNPSSIHLEGQRARYLIEEARDGIAELLDCGDEYRVVFTSGATESNNTAILSPFWYSTHAEVITLAVEHPSVLEPLSRLEERGTVVKRLCFETAEELPKRVAEECTDATRLVTVMCANNETGEIFPVQEIVTELRKRAYPPRIHTDAVQAVGKIPLSVRVLGVDTLSLSAHKIGGISGVGALLVRKGSAYEPLFLGGPQELRHRAGTENVLGIAAFGVAAREAIQGLEERRIRVRSQCERLWQALNEALPRISARFLQRELLPNTLSLSLEGVLADDLVVGLDLRGIRVSSGAACASGKPDPSHVLLARGYTEDEARSTIRISLRFDHSEKEIDEAIKGIVECVRKMRGNSEHTR